MAIDYLECVAVLAEFLQLDAVQIHVGTALREVLLEGLNLGLGGRELLLYASFLLLRVLEMVVDLLVGQLQVTLQKKEEVDMLCMHESVH